MVVFVLEMLETQTIEDFVHSFVSLFPAHHVIERSKHHVLVYRRHEHLIIRILQHKAELLSYLSEILLVYLDVVDENLALALHKAEKQLHYRGLARAVGTDQAYAFPVLYSKRQTLYDRSVALI